MRVCDRTCPTTATNTVGKAKTIEQYMDEIEAKERELKNNKSYTTPLLDFVREQRKEKRAKRDLKREARKRRDEERKRAREEERKARKEGDRGNEGGATSRGERGGKASGGGGRRSDRPDKPPKSSTISGAGKRKSHVKRMTSFMLFVTVPFFCTLENSSVIGYQFVRPRDFLEGLRSK